MTNIVAAYKAIKRLAEDELAANYRLVFPDDCEPLPDDPDAFIYFEFQTERGDFIEMGGGPGGNRYRHSCELVAYVFKPRQFGLEDALAAAEPVAAIFRSYHANGISCQGASVHPVGEGESLVPPGLSSAAGNYVCVMVAVPLHFDQAA